jgi:hypothetical protein
MYCAETANRKYNIKPPIGKLCICTNMKTCAFFSFCYFALRSFCEAFEKGKIGMEVYGAMDRLGV